MRDDSAGVETDVVSTERDVDAERPHEFVIRSRDPIKKGEAFCTDCGRMFTLVLTGGEDQLGNSAVLCDCGQILSLSTDDDWAG